MDLNNNQQNVHLFQRPMRRLKMFLLKKKIMVANISPFPKMFPILFIDKLYHVSQFHFVFWNAYYGNYYDFMDS